MTEIQSARELINNAIPVYLNTHILQPKMREAAQYALSGGKRLRSMITLGVMEALTKHSPIPPPCIMGIALSIEFIHCASLIVDDLPCMDNDTMRRGKPTTHIAFGEATALLLSISLVCQSLNMVWHNINDLKRLGYDEMWCNERAARIVNEIAKHTGSMGAAGGQFLESIIPHNNSGEKETIRDLIYKKTSSFFEASFINGWIMGNGSNEQIQRVRSLGKNFGFAFQVADDIDDMEVDKAAGRGATNYAVVAGIQFAQNDLNEAIDQCIFDFKFLGLTESALLTQIMEWLLTLRK